MASNIVALRAAGCQIIVDDITYDDESPFQDGVISRAVQEVSSSGILYFSSARNSGSLKHRTSGTWEGDFRDGGPAGAQFGAAGPNSRMHMFAKGVILNTVVRADKEDRVDLFWSDPLGRSSNGYDLFVINNKGQVVRSATTSHTGRQDPYQSIDKLHAGESIAIVKVGGAEDRFIHLDTGRAVLRYGTNGNVRGHNASEAENAFSIAAIRVPRPPTPFGGGSQAIVEDFSSDGPRRVFYERSGTPITPGNFSSTGGRLVMKPDLTGANGVSTTLPLTSHLNPFFGTSAAAPHAAAIAALLLSCNPRPSTAAVRQAMRMTALIAEGSHANANAGDGIVMARAAAGQVCERTGATYR